jgi:hypothetical protein
LFWPLNSIVLIFELTVPPSKTDCSAKKIFIFIHAGEEPIFFDVHGGEYTTPRHEIWREEDVQKCWRRQIGAMVAATVHLDGKPLNIAIYIVAYSGQTKNAHVLGPLGFSTKQLQSLGFSNFLFYHYDLKREQSFFFEFPHRRSESDLGFQKIKIIFVDGRKDGTALTIFPSFLPPPKSYPSSTIKLFANSLV